jgi:hypothetical protein
MQRDIEDFLSEYAAQVARVQAELEQGDPPTLLRAGDSLVLRHRRHKARVSVLTPAFESLMHACHVPSLWALVHEDGEPVPEHVSQLARALRSREDVDPAAAALLDACLALLEPPRPRAWEEIRARLLGPIEFCIARAAVLELARLHEVTSDLLARCGDDGPSIGFVVCAGHQPRYRELTKQYFRALVTTRWPSADVEARVTYAESQDEAGAIRLVAARRVDRGLAKRIWNEPERMERDVLGDAAKAALDAFDLR